MKKNLFMKFAICQFVTFAPLGVNLLHQSPVYAKGYHLNKSFVNLMKGSSCRLSVVQVRKGVKWTSSNSKVASVDATGKVIGRKNGWATISAYYKRKKMTCKFHIINVNLSTFTKYNGHHYKYFPSDVSWSKAEWYCENMGGHLATITSMGEQFTIEDIADSNSAWIGATRNSNDYNSWHWVTGEKWNFTNWGDGEPNNSSNVISNETKACIWPHKWNDLNDESTEQSGYICEIDS